MTKLLCHAGYRSPAASKSDARVSQGVEIVEIDRLSLACGKHVAPFVDPVPLQLPCHELLHGLSSPPTLAGSRVRLSRFRT